MRSDKDLEQRLEKQFNDVDSFNNSIKNNKEMITYFKEKSNKSKKKNKKYKTLNTISKSIDTFVIIATASNCVTLSITGVGLIDIPKTTATVCGLSIGNKVIYEITMKKYNKYKMQFEKDQQTVKSFDQIYRKSLQDKMIDKTENESLCNNFTKYLDEKTRS